MKKISEKDRVLAYFATAEVDEAKALLSSVSAILKSRTPKSVKSAKKLPAMKPKKANSVSDDATLPHLMV